MNFLKLALQGTTTVVATGDYGVTWGQCLGKDKIIFVPPFPTSCPYVLSFAATSIPPKTPFYEGIEATSTFSSGSGFSNVYDIPSDQKDAVNNYLDHYVPDYPYYSSSNNNPFGANGGIYYRNGCGIPDVSTLGQETVLITNGTRENANGTSAFAPIWASMLTKINDMRINAGKGPAGFVNPVLYARLKSFNDMTVGSNGQIGCGENGAKGLTASPGWDAVTGLGTSKVDVLKDVFVGLL